jgi:hypothetical protein
MYKHHICQILAAGLLWAATAPADVVWSGSMYQRTYHDVPAIDFNLDGTNDFTFNLEVRTISGTSYIYSIEPANGQIVVEKISDTLSDGGWPLEAGTVISANVDVPGPVDVVWDASEASLFVYSFPSDAEGVLYGGWFSHNYQGYLGVSFDVDESTHYGWIEFSHDRTRPDPLNNSLMIHGWAYENTPDTPISAGVIPEPSTGILTMVGSLGLLLHARSRRREKQPNQRIDPTSANEQSSSW